MSNETNNDILSSRETSPVPAQKSACISVGSKPRIFQKFMRENSFGSIQKNEERKLGSSCTIETQTEWSYLEDAELIVSLRKHLAVAEWKALIARVDRKKEEKLKITTDIESEEEDLDSRIESPKQKIESIGPPKILKFKPEVKEVVEVEAPSPAFSIPSAPVNNVSQFMQGFNVHVKGGEICEFCEDMTKPWPTIAEQEEFSPDELYCCNDYKEYVDGLINYQTEKEKLINADESVVRPGQIKAENNPPKVNKLIKERDDHKNMQKLLEKQRKLEELAARKQEQLQQKQQKEHAPRKEEMTTPSKPIKEHTKDSHISRDTKEAGSKENSTLNPNLVNQMKSINYQLSNLKYIQDGWTVRPRSRINYNGNSDADDDMNLLTSNSEPMFKRTPFDFDKRVFDRSLVIKKYKDGKDCLILFPDGSGNVFYSSGRLALSIILVAPGMHIITAYTDDQTASQIAQFDPFGNGSCSYMNGSVRLLLTPNGGLELDNEGHRKKKWQWAELHENHVHAPPFQSLNYVLNNQISVKLVSQEKINVDFISEGNICKFRINIKPKQFVLSKLDATVVNTIAKNDNVDAYLSRKRGRIEDLFRLMNQEDANIFKLPRIIGTLNKDLAPSRLTVDVTKTKNLKARKASSKFVTV